MVAIESPDSPLLQCGIKNIRSEYFSRRSPILADQLNKCRLSESFDKKGTMVPYARTYGL